jgi:hypothetical protein
MMYRRGYRHFVFGKCRLALVFAVSVLVSCQSVRGPDVEEQVGGIEIRGLRILNRSFGTVTEVQLLVTRTGEFISCGNIAMRGQCSTTFPLRQYQGNQIEIRWKQGSSEWSTGEFVVEANERIDPSRPAIVQVILNSQGLAPTELVQ